MSVLLFAKVGFLEDSLESRNLAWSGVVSFWLGFVGRLAVVALVGACAGFMKDPHGFSAVSGSSTPMVSLGLALFVRASV